MEVIFKKTKIRDYLFIFIGTALMAVSINLIYDPMGMVTGGVTGVGIIVKYLTRNVFSGGIPVWLTNIALNIPLFLAAFFLKGKEFIGRTLITTIALTAFIYVIPVVNLFEGDYLLAAVFGGVIGGVGIGLVLATMSTTGGSDMFCALLHEKWKHYSIPQLLILVDGLIVFGGVAVFHLKATLYAAITIYITAKVSDGILEGLKFSKMAFIISDQYRAIANEILHSLNRGVSGLEIEGMYSNQEKKMLFCVVSKKEMVEVLDIVYKNDARAFVVVNDVREVMGEGFIENIQDKQ